MKKTKDKKLTQKHMVEMEVSALKPHPDNPRKHSKEQVKQIGRSIKQFGFKFPILIDGEGRIIAGHGRVQAAKEVGMPSVPALRVDDLSEGEIRALMLADNKLTENGEWDEDLLAKNFRILDELDINFDLDITGFDYGEIEGFLALDEKAAVEIEEIPEVNEKVVSQRGDLWVLGEHRIYCGDAVDASSYEVLLQGKKACMVFMDPPYNLRASTIGNVCEKRHGDFKYGGGEMSEEEFIDFLQKVFRRSVKQTREGSVHYVCMDWRHVGEIVTAGKREYSEMKNVCVWVKEKGGMGSFYRSQHELIFVFKNGKEKHQNNFKLGQYGRTRTNVWEYPSVRSFREEGGDVKGKEALILHPTIKPVKMIEDAIKDCSRRGEIVLDNFIGSGSTLIACEKQKRLCCGIELEPRYVDVCIKRWEKWTGKEAICENRGKRKYKEISEESS